MVNPEPWCDPVDLTGEGCPCSFASLTEATATDAVVLATRVLYAFTGERWPGEQSTTIRPVVHRSCGERWAAWQPYTVLDLPGYPVRGITTVTIDGTALASSAWRLVDARYLVRIDGETWPQIADPVTTGRWVDDASFTVAYTWGADPPPDARTAAASLACQLALAATPKMSNEGRLPKRLTTITRNGVSMAVLDPLTLFANDQTGLPEVDAWIAAVNRRPSYAAVHVPGRRDRHRRWAPS